MNIFVLLVGCILTFPAGFKLFNYTNHYLKSTHIDGTVVKMGKGRNIGCRPDIRYVDMYGAEHEFKTKVLFHIFFCPQVGDSMKVLYIPDKPEETILASFFHYVMMGGGFFLIGLYLISTVLRGRIK